MPSFSYDAPVYGSRGPLGISARIRRERLPSPDRYAAPERLPAPMSSATTPGGGRATSAVSEYGGSASVSPYAAPHGPFGPRGRPPAAPTPRPITPGAGDYADIGPGDPAGYLSAPYSAEYPFESLQDMVRYLIRGGGQEGVFQPGYLRNAMRKRALGNAAGQRSRAGLLGQLIGFDPSEQRGNLADADMAASGELTRSLNNADLADLMQYQNLIQQLLQSERGGESGLFTSRDLLERQLAGQKQGLGDYFGQALGIGAGAFAGGMAG